MKKQIVVTLWRNTEHFDPGAIQSIRDILDRAEIEFVRRDPVDRRDYEKMCAELRPKAVVLPRHPVPFSVLPMTQGIWILLEIDRPPYMGAFDPTSVQLAEDFDPYEAGGNFSYLLGPDDVLLVCKDNK